MSAMSTGPVGGITTEAAGIRWSSPAAAGPGIVAWSMVLRSLRCLAGIPDAASSTGEFSS